MTFLLKTSMNFSMKKLILIVLCILPHLAAKATTSALPAGPAKSCGQILDIHQFIQCALNQHIHILDLKSQEQVASLKQGAASYRPNPKVDFQGGVGQNVGDILTQFQISMVMPVEVGGKRSSRMSLADAELQQAKIEKDYGTLEVLIDVYIHILKIHELYIHEKSFKNSVQFVDRVYKLYQSRAHLDPEQQASKYLFEMLKQKYSFELILLAKDIEANLNELVLMTQNQISKEDLKTIIMNLPEPQWPELKTEYSGKSLWVQRLKAETLVKEKKYDFEISESFPDFEVGPYYSQEYQGPLLTQFLGVTANFPLPVFNINSGGRALAKAEMESSIKKTQLMEAKEELEMKFLLESYQSMTKELTKLRPLLHNIEKANPSKGLFERGLIPATLAIENQRTHQELIMTAHELEVKTLEILFKIRSIEGNLDTEKLTLWPK